MVKFQVSLNLHNYRHLSDTKYSEKKAKKIIKFYKAIATLIQKFHNLDIKRTQKQFKEYSEPLIKISKNIFTETVSGVDDPLASFLESVCPPTIDIQMEFHMTSRREELALRQFYKEYKKTMSNKSYRELRTLYYSTKIIQFVNNLRSLINNDVLWFRYINRAELKTKYKPVITVSDVTVLSLT